jgi:uncharacterized coiled-coil protein SlyX
MGLFSEFDQAHQKPTYEQLEAKCAEQEKQLSAMTKERDCWIFNAKELQKGYNEQEKQLAELRNALVNADKELDIFNEDAVCDHSVGICWCSYIRMRDDIKKAITQSSDKWLNEQKAKALEELADWFNAEEQDAWEIAGEIRNKASELRSKT